MDNNKAIDALNTLITINNDRIEGYETASKETEEKELKSLFSGFISNSENCKQELVREVRMLGGQEADGTKISGKFFRVWMDVKSALSGKDREVILDSCKYGEDEAQNTYNDIIVNNLKYLSVEQGSMITAQQQLLMSDRDQVNALKKAM